MRKNITEMREICKELIGSRLVDITTNDPDEDPFVELLFENGETLRFPVTPQAIIAEL